MARPATIEQISRDVRILKRELVEKPPHHFRISAKQIMGAVFGAFIFGLTFALKGLLLDISALFTQQNRVLILVFTFVILSGVIRYVGYARVTETHRRRFGQFWLKRIVLYFATGLAVSWVLVYIYGLNHLVSTPEHLQNVIVALTLPCSLGASIADLLEKY